MTQGPCILIPSPIAPNGSPYILEVGLFVESNQVYFLSDYFVDWLMSFGLVRSWILFVVLLQYTLLFLELVLFVRVWRDILQRPIELERCGPDVLCGGPQRSPFCLISRIFSRIGSWGLVVRSFIGSCFFFVVGPFVGSDSCCSLVGSVTGSDQKLDDLIKRLSLIHIWRCRRYSLCRSRWSPYH